METIKIITKPDSKGYIHIQVPSNFSQEELEATITFKNKSEITNENSKKPNGEELAKIMKKIADMGGLVSEYGDALEWQKEIRKDRDLPYPWGNK